MASPVDAGPDAIVIRRARRRDIPTIVRMIRGLAAYEHLTGELRMTAAHVRQHGFGPRRYFETLLCEHHGRVIGFALYFFTYSTFLARPTLYLEDLFVLPDARGRGAGTALLRALARIAVARQCGRMEWTVLDWNTPAIQVYERLGARLRRDWILTRLTGQPLRRLARPAPRTLAAPHRGIADHRAAAPAARRSAGRADNAAGRPAGARRARPSSPPSTR